HPPRPGWGHSPERKDENQDAPANGHRQSQGHLLAHRTAHRSGTRGFPSDRRRLQHPPTRRPTAPERPHGRGLSRVHQEQAQFEERHRTGPARLSLGPSRSRRVTHRSPTGETRRLVGNISKAGTVATPSLLFLERLKNPVPLLRI